MNYQTIRNNASVLEQTYGLTYLTQERRMPKIWKTAEAIKGAAAAAGVGHGGQFREARLRLAREVYGKQFASYNDLTDPQLDALSQWATTQGLELKNWLITKYGEQTKF